MPNSWWLSGVNAAVSVPVVGRGAWRKVLPCWWTRSCRISPCANIEGANGTAARFHWVKAPTSQELTQLTHTIAQRIGRSLERQGLLERDAENSYLASDAVDEDPMNQLLGSSITYCIAVGPQAGRKVFTLQTLPACDPEDQFGDTLGKVSGFSLHAGVAAKAHERDKLERLCRYIARPAVSEKRLALTSHGNVRYQLKTPYRDGTTHVAALAHPCASRHKCVHAQNLRAPGVIEKILTHLEKKAASGGTGLLPEVRASLQTELFG